MKVTVTKEFGSPEEAAAWLRVFAPSADVPETAPPINTVADAVALLAEKKPRKPRNDAGKPRGPYKTNGGPASSNPGVPESALAPTPQPAEPVSPTNTAGAVPEGQSPAAGGSPAPTLDDARAALALINKTPGMGMPAVMLHLQDFGTNRASLLKPEQYAAFVASAKQKVADHEAAVARSK
jgi:hypothetical protein